MPMRYSPQKQGRTTFTMSNGWPTSTWWAQRAGESEATSWLKVGDATHLCDASCGPRGEILDCVRHGCGCVAWLRTRKKEREGEKVVDESKTVESDAEAVAGRPP